MKATVGIITHNRSEIIEKCLDGIRRQTTKPAKIIIVDTSEDEKTSAVVKKFRLPIEYIHLKKRVRQPAARNIVLKKTRSDIIAFIDDDAVPEPEWLENIISGYSTKDIAGVAGPAVNCDLRLRPLSKLKYTNRVQNRVNSFGDVRFSDSWIPSKPVKCNVMIGANMSFLTKKLRSVGGFVDFYTEGYGFREENFPQMSLIKNGSYFLYMPKALVWHIKIRTGGAEKHKDHFYLCGKNHRKFADKFFPRWKTRLSWIFWSVSPPCLWLCVAMAIIRRDVTIFGWHRGLWFRD